MRLITVEDSANTVVGANNRSPSTLATAAPYRLEETIIELVLMSPEKGGLLLKTRLSLARKEGRKSLCKPRCLRTPQHTNQQVDTF